MDESEVLVADAELELTNGFDEGGTFDVTDGSTKLEIELLDL
jgi:hypothetical protein